MNNQHEQPPDDPNNRSITKTTPHNTTPTSETNDIFVTSATIRQQYRVSNSSLVRWSQENKLAARKMPGGKRLYNKRQLQLLIGENNNESTTQTTTTTTNPVLKQTRINICYARVSSSHQSADLDRQIEFLKHSYPNHEIIKDIGSGLNFQRKGFVALLERVMQGDVETVVVQHKDRLCRFGSELVEWIFRRANTKLVVHSQIQGNREDTAKQQHKTDESSHSRQELSDDILAIVNFFVARNNGRRSADNRRERKRHRESEDQVTGQKEENEGGPRKKARRKTQEASSCGAGGVSINNSIVDKTQA
jgi:putative resolvase